MYSCLRVMCIAGTYQIENEFKSWHMNKVSIESFQGQPNYIADLQIYTQKVSLQFTSGFKNFNRTICQNAPPFLYCQNAPQPEKYNFSSNFKMYCSKSDYFLMFLEFFGPKISYKIHIFLRLERLFFQEYGYSDVCSGAIFGLRHGDRFIALQRAVV